MIRAERIKEAVTVPMAAEYYGLRSSRQGFCCCPFHAEKTPSCKLNKEYFYCFGCQEHGDVINLVAQVLDVSVGEAMRQLENDFHIAPESKPSKERIMKKCEKRDENAEYRVLNRYYKRLKRYLAENAPQSSEEELDELFVYAQQHISFAEYLLESFGREDVQQEVKRIEFESKELDAIEKMRRIAG